MDGPFGMGTCVCKYLNVFERSRTDSTGAHSYLTDNLGSTLALTNSAGAISISYSYEPYGNTTASGTSSTNALQYTGRENDGDRLYYYRARYYSPVDGRFISEDPLGLAGGINTYIYVLDNPLNAIDPLGFWTFQMGLSGSFTLPFGLSFTGSIGFAIDGHGEIAPFYAGGFGAGLGSGLSGGVFIGASNANTVCDLGGPFDNLSIGGGWGPDATGDAFYGYGTQGQPVLGGALTLGLGLGATSFGGGTGTHIGSVGRLW
ncbi:MAG: RHS repeat-associated core domain-containing protein [Gammaproteobacteria bacterium]